MKVKNYQEELVLNTINLVLEDRPEVKPDELLIHDVAAYTLNRIPPKYIMSERGFTRLASEYWLDNGSEHGITSLVELVLIINRAIDLVTSRRQGVREGFSSIRRGDELSIIGRIEFWHNFPQLIGRVLDGSTKEPVFGVVVTLSIDGNMSVPAEPGWQNPYHTNFGTKGFYSFWPSPIHNVAELKQFIVRVTFEHGDYQSGTEERKLDTAGELQLNNIIKVNEICNLGTTFLEHK